MNRTACRLLLLTALGLCAQEPKKDAAEKPQWQRMLSGEDAKKAKELAKAIAEATKADRIAEASIS